MTIEESAKELQRLRKKFNSDQGDYCIGGTDTMFALDTALDIMRKHQRIKQIIDNWNNYIRGDVCGYGENTYMKMIEGVIEDGDVSR